MSRGYGWVFIKWTKYYIVGKVFEANINQEHSGDQHGDARFNIIYFGDTLPAGVSEESFGDTNILQYHTRDQRIKTLTALLANELQQQQEELDRKAIDIG